MNFLLYFVQGDRYAYPTVTICVVAGAVRVGCDSEDYYCAHSMSTSIYNPVGFENTNVDDDNSNAAVLNEVRVEMEHTPLCYF